MAHKTTLGKGHVTEHGITLKLETQEDAEQFVQSLTSLADAFFKQADNAWLRPGSGSILE